MTDEHLMRQWGDAHSDFTSDLDRGLLRLGGYLSRRFQRRQPIDQAYEPARAHDAEMSSSARAALAGVMACVATTVLLVAVASLATSGTIDTATLQADIPTGSPIVGHAMA